MTVHLTYISGILLGKWPLFTNQLPLGTGRQDLKKKQQQQKEILIWFYGPSNLLGF